MRHLGGDDQDSVAHRQEMIDEAMRQAAQGSIITLCWHKLRPTEDEPGTPLHKRWEKYMDAAAGYLKQLQDAKIPVLYRPMHENNSGFFWWGGRPGMGGTAELFRQVYVHHLDNLLKYADIIGYDNYYYELLALGEIGQPFAPELLNAQ